MNNERCLNLNHSESCRCGASETPKPPEPMLAPCPFCGGRPYETRTVNGSQMYLIGCASCGFEFKAAWYRDQPAPTKDIKGSWNRRSVSVPSTPTTASFFIPTEKEGEGTIASEILRETARMRKDGSFATSSLCWSPEQLELLAMFAIDAKNKLAAPTPKDAERHVKWTEVAAFLQRAARKSRPSSVAVAHPLTPEK